MIRKIVRCFMLIFMCVLLLTACKAKTEKSESRVYQLYYSNKNQTKLLQTEYETEENDKLSLAAELLTQLKLVPEDLSALSVIPFNVEANDETLKFEGNIMSIYFDSTYPSVGSIEEILCRAAVVKTLSQIDDIDFVSFYVAGNPLIDAKGKPVDVMSVSDFLEGTGDKVNTFQKTTLTLYFANETGTHLVSTSNEVIYDTNMSMETVVITQLINGPETKGAYPTLPKDTKILSVSTRDNICYVKLNSKFLENNLEVSDHIPIYSIVNSLSEVSNINKVQILINERKDAMFRDTISLNVPFERDLDYIGE
jgi:Spore germination protein